MRTSYILSGLLFGATMYCLIAAEPMAKLREPAADAILQQITRREKDLKRVTEAPYSIDRQLAMLCRSPNPNQLPAENPHRGHAIHVYVTPSGEEVLKSGKGTYPVGTLIVKEKFPSPLDELRAPKIKGKSVQPVTELFTAMLKRDPGYDPERGDWEYLVISGNATQVLARGKLDSCIQCHVDYKATDYVTRAYLK